MAKSTQVKIKVKGIDQASAVFRKVGRTAKSVAVGLAAISAAGLAAAVAVGKTWAEMTKIGDLAAKSATSATELQRLASAFGQLGIQGMSLENVSQALAVMQKNTGRSGLTGFLETIDEAKKGGGLEYLTKVFGKSGINFGSLLGGSTEDLKAVIDLQFAAGDAAVDSATKATNSWNLFTDGCKAAWFDFMGQFAKDLDENIDGGVYAAAFKAVAYVKAAISSIMSGFKVVWGACKVVAGALAAPFLAVGKLIAGIMAQVMNAFESLVEAVRTWSTDPLKQGWENAKNIAIQNFEDILNNGGVKMFSEGLADITNGKDGIKKAFEDAAVEAAKASEKAKLIEEKKAGAVGKPFGGTTDKTKTDSLSIGAARNDLILGGSHASMLAVNRRNTDAIRTRIATEKMATTLENIGNKIGNIEVA